MQTRREFFRLEKEKDKGSALPFGPPALPFSGGVGEAPQQEPDQVTRGEQDTTLPRPGSGAGGLGYPREAPRRPACNPGGEGQPGFRDDVLRFQTVAYNHPFCDTHPHPVPPPHLPYPVPPIPLLHTFSSGRNNYKQHDDAQRRPTGLSGPLVPPNGYTEGRVVTSPG